MNIVLYIDGTEEDKDIWDHYYYRDGFIYSSSRESVYTDTTNVNFMSCKYLLYFPSPRKLLSVKKTWKR